MTSAGPRPRSLADLPRPIALVVSGGACLGAVQVGQLRAVAEAGLVPDLVVGASVGTLHGTPQHTSRQHTSRHTSRFAAVAGMG